MIGGVTRHILPHLSGAPHLHVNRPYLRPLHSQYPIAFRADMNKSKTYPACKVWLATAQNWNKSFTHIFPRRLGTLNLNPHLWMFTSFSVRFKSRFHSFTSATVRIAVHISLMCGPEPIRYVNDPLLRSARPSFATSRTDIAPKSPWLLCVNRSPVALVGYLRNPLDYWVFCIFSFSSS